MGYFFFDESIHPEPGFIVGAWAYSDKTPDGDIKSAFYSAGVNPDREEFKSSSTKNGTTSDKSLRDNLRGILQSCRLGLLIHPSSKRDSLALQSIKCLDKLILRNGLRAHHQVYLDEGLWDFNIARSFADDIETLKLCEFHFEQDSKAILGIQLADLAASTCATMLKDQLGLVKKKILMDDNSGYIPGALVELGWELWAKTRRSFFHGPVSVDPDTLNPDNPTANVSNFGLFISEDCDPDLKNAAEERFGEMYLGCIF